MFRPRIKKRKNNRINTTIDDDDEEEDVPHKKKILPDTTTTPTDSDDNDEDLFQGLIDQIKDPYDEEEEDDDNNDHSLLPPQSQQTHKGDLYENMSKALEEIQAKKQQLERELQQQQTNPNNNNNPQEIHKHGQALEFYQKWRLGLVQWTGALRNLLTRIEPIEDAMHVLQADVANLTRWNDTQQDFCRCLQHYELLDKVVGKQLEQQEQGETVQDEFGRDVLSKAVLAAQKRAEQRKKIRRQRFLRQEEVFGDESDAFHSDQEIEDIRERDVALAEALDVAKEEMDDDFTKMHNLFDLFKEWYELYPHDYKESHAGLSLADLASVLVRLELCHLNDPNNESASFNEAKWTTVILKAVKDGYMDQEAVERLLEKAIHRSIQDLLGKKGYNVVSTKQTQTLSSFCSRVSRIASPDSPGIQKIRNLFSQYIREYLENLTIPIPKDGTPPGELDEDQELELHTAIYAPMLSLSKTLSNVLDYWAPILGEDMDFVSYLLEYISNNFLYLLYAVKPCSQHPFKHAPSDLFQTIWDSLQSLNWVEAPEYMIQSAPIRAAANNYEIIKA